jgi:hypothetical protein
MLAVLMYIIILGIIAWAVQQIPMPQPFRVAAWCIVLIILVVLIFRFLTTVNLGL